MADKDTNNMEATEEVITAQCPKLKNLELNLQDLGFFDEGTLDFMDEIKTFIETASELFALVIREPSEEIQDYLSDHPEFGYDKVYGNFMFTHSRYDYRAGYLCHHNVNFGNCPRTGSDS